MFFCTGYITPLSSVGGSQLTEARIYALFMFGFVAYSKILASVCLCVMAITIGKFIVRLNYRGIVVLVG